MYRNFLAMPSLLQFLTAGTVLVIAFFVSSTIPHSSVNVMGGVMSTDEWWKSGAATVIALNAILFAVSATLMLKRSRYGRHLYIVGSIVSCLSLPVVAMLTQANAVGATNVFTLTIFNFVLTAFIGIYLYRNRAVESYFHHKPAPS